MSIIMIFNRKVIPFPPVSGEKDTGNGKVEAEVVGFIDGEPFTPGTLKFPNKQSWTKFWGALQRGALQVPELEVKMENVPPTDEDLSAAGIPDPVAEFRKTMHTKDEPVMELKKAAEIPSVKFIGKQP